MTLEQRITDWYRKGYPTSIQSTRKEVEEMIRGEMRAENRDKLAHLIKMFRMGVITSDEMDRKANDLGFTEGDVNKAINAQMRGE